MSGLLESIRPKSENRPPERSVAAVDPVAAVAVVPPPAVRTTTDCPHRQTRIVEIREDFSFDADGKIRYDQTKPPIERFEECLRCGEWLDLDLIEEESIEEEKEKETDPVGPVCNFAW